MPKEKRVLEINNIFPLIVTLIGIVIITWANLIQSKHELTERS